MADTASQAPRFESIDQAIETMRYWPKELPFPLTDDLSPELMVQACNSKLIKESLSQKSVQESWRPRLSGDMAAGLLSYEDNAERLERKMGWSALSIWSAAYESQERLWAGPAATMTKQDMSKSFKSLINSGANLELARWTNADLPLKLIKEGMMDEMALLCEAGFNLNAPYVFSPGGVYSNGINLREHFFPFISVCSQIEKLSNPERLQALKIAVNCALSQGCEIDARDTAGLTPLGLALLRSNDGSSLNGGGEYISLLLDLGADPLKVPRHPLALCANHDLLRGAALARAQKESLERGLEASPRQALSRGAPSL